MSHTKFVYPQSTDDLTLIQKISWQVREDEAEDGESHCKLPDLTKLANLSDSFSDKLTKFEALSWVLQEGEALC